MAALDFPDNPTNGQVFDKWTWNGTMWVLTASGSGGGGGSGFTFNQDAVPTATSIGDTWFETDTGDSFVWTNDGNSTQWVQFAPGSGGGGGSGFTYVTDTKPTPSKVGDTWFDTSTLASGGTSWLAIEESPGGEKVWVQTSPGAGAIPTTPPKITEFEYTPGAAQTGNQTYTITTSMPTASMTGRASITAATALLPNTGTMAMAVLMFPLSAPAFGLGSPQFQVRAETPTITSGTWYTPVPLTAWSPITAGVKPGLQFQIFAGNLTVQWYVQFRITVVEYAT